MLSFEPLKHYALVRFSGEDAQKFLQGQFTQDMSLVEQGKVYWTGYCTPKGRLLGNGLIWQNSEGFWWQPRIELSPSLIKRLSMFVLRDKVKIEDDSERLGQLGIYADSLDQAMSELSLPCPALGECTVSPEGLQVIRPYPQRAIVIGEEKILYHLREKNSIKENAHFWQRAQISEGFPEVTLAQQDQWIPQMLNMDLIHGIGFKKGCYTGQEIVARTHYLGQVKRRTVLFTCDSPVEEGDTLVNDADQETLVGHVINHANNIELPTQFLAVVQVEAVRQSQSLRISRTRAEAKIVPLPYKVVEV
ncbi:MAG: folate-binding protein YgfZ [Betaproteobacteria bacterium]|nr:folate-binding protein YgfZ [Betaproteobacteria bacterium]